MIGIVIDPYGHVESKDIEDSVDGIHQAIGCECFDVVPMLVDGERYTVYCDDEGYFKTHIVPTIVSADGRVRIVGKCLIVNAEEGCDLAKSDIKRILNRVRLISDGARYHEVVMCDARGLPHQERFDHAHPP